MISALVQGVLIADPMRRITASGKPFATGTVRVAGGPESALIGVIAFGEPAQAALLRIKGGDTLVASGVLQLNTWVGREGKERRDWRLSAIKVMSLYQARKRRAVPPTEVAP